MSNPPPTTETAIKAGSNLPASPSNEVATFASGCFWGTEHIFQKYYKTKGIKTAVGYTGGKAATPSYRTVCSGSTGHAESVRVEFDPSQVAYAELVEFFYRTHDPTTLNSQGADRGTQYRSAIFYHSPDQKAIAEAVTAEVQKKHIAGKTIVTEITEADQWWDAEDYHQEYLFKNPHGYQCPTHRLHW
ncbi:hypothetical protein BS47DRAFT_1375136 [Hydnum rufescens UP504]|uniref:peptide-methionine (S)-S-oxide reductase n=1 Tax=Hydnum rufescens UP504 TaxID=1448309 RepID=A0A9P6B7T5_9AGAM|nr:hypothetical protein BS47DRAFT_1375136 [Hydnum rufescens UP504]